MGKGAANALRQIAGSGAADAAREYRTVQRSGNGFRGGEGGAALAQLSPTE